jgi:hypothetical protein
MFPIETTAAKGYFAAILSAGGAQEHDGNWQTITSYNTCDCMGRSSCFTDEKSNVVQALIGMGEYRCDPPQDRPMLIMLHQETANRYRPPEKGQLPTFSSCSANARLFCQF